jgi:V/A-type H+-transporting ATPase subunit E
MTSGLDAIRNAIIQRAEERAAEIVKEAEEERNRLLSEAREEAKNTSFRLLEDAKSEAEVRHEERLGSIRNDLRRRVLTKREELIDMAWGRATDELGAHVQTPGYQSELKELAIATARLVEEDSFLVSANRRDLDTLGNAKEQIEAALGHPGKTMALGKVLDCIGGIEVSDPEGKVVLDRTYESRIRRLRPELRSKLARILTGGQG